MKFNGPQQGIREETLFFQCLQGKSWLLRVLNLCTSTLESSKVYVNDCGPAETKPTIVNSTKKRPFQTLLGGSTTVLEVRMSSSTPLFKMIKKTEV